MLATNFEEFVLKMAEEAPHAVVLDWYRRVDLTVRDYRRVMRANRRKGETAESIIARDALLGSNVANQLVALRTLRNDVAHTGIATSVDSAIAYARQCFALIGVIVKLREDLDILNDALSKAD